MSDHAGGPVLVSVHVPKCAGTTLRLYFERAFGGRHRNLYVNTSGFVYGEAELRAEALGDPAVASVSSHFIRTFAPVVAGRTMLYYTFLREPVQHFLSFRSYIAKVYRHIRDANTLAAVPPDADRISSREFARWVLDQPLDVPFRESYATNFFARYVWSAATGRGPAAGAPWPEAWDPADLADYRRERLAVAMRVLDGFFSVGVCEETQAGLDELRRRAAGHGFDLPPATLGVENVSYELRDDAGWIRPDDEVGGRLLASMADDFELYAHARRLAGLAGTGRRAAA